MATRLPTPWTRTLALTCAWLLATAAAGALAGHAWAGLACGALAACAWQAWRLRALLVALAGRRRFAEPGRRGAWDEVERLMARGQQDLRARKRRLVGMLRAYRALADALPDAVVVFERDSQRIAWFNAAANRLLGLRHPVDIAAPLGERLRSMPVARWLASGRHAEPLSDVPSPVDASLRLSLRLVPYSEDLWLLIVRDVSRLTRLEQMRRDFVANVSHELRTPLTVVHGYLEMLDPAEHPDWAPMLGEMQRQSRRMAQLVEDLLALSRLESRDALDEERVAMAPMLAALRREAEALSQGRHAIVLDDVAGVDLWGSPHELHSAFSNLFSNAVRYTPEGGTITIAFRRGGGGAVLAVADTGQGIPAAHLPRLTERFYRVSTSRSRETGGTGLGLAIVKHVLGLHQARLEIDSEVGRGSTFSCVFGVERLRPREPAAHAEAP